jgi:hypothetical protein
VAWLRCPRCSHTFRAGASATHVCPACGWRGWTPAPSAVPQESPYYRPAPEGMVGRPRSYLAFLALSLVTLLVYPLVYYWKAFAELDQQAGRRSPKAWYVAWLVFAVILAVGGVLEALFYYWDEPVDDLAAHAALFGTAAAMFLLCGAMHITLGLARLRDYRRARGLGRPIGGFTFCLIVALGIGAGLAGGWVVTQEVNFTEAMGYLVVGLGGVAGLMVGTAVATAFVNAQVNAVWRVIGQEQAYQLAPASAPAEV